MNSTGSSLERDVKCPGNRALPVVQQTTEAATAGNTNHARIEGGLSVGGDLSGLPIVVQRAMADASEVHSEAAFAINVNTGGVRFLGYSIGRNYGDLDPAEIALTIDAVIISKNGLTCVWDWKSRKRVTGAKDNLQLHAGAVAVMRWLGLPMVGIGIGYLDDGEEDRSTFDAFDAESFLETMRGMYRRISEAREQAALGKPPNVHAGPWCEYCPGLPYCPAHNRLALQMMGDLTTIEQKVAFMSVEQVGKAWPIVKEIMRVAERVEASLKMRVRHDVVILPNGKRLAMVQSHRTSIDRDKAIARLREHGLPVDDLQKTTYFDVVKEVKA